MKLEVTLKLMRSSQLTLRELPDRSHNQSPFSAIRALKQALASGRWDFQGTQRPIGAIPLLKDWKLKS